MFFRGANEQENVNRDNDGLDRDDIFIRVNDAIDRVAYDDVFDEVQ